jgi:hypothetical protein
MNTMATATANNTTQQAVAHKSPRAAAPTVAELSARLYAAYEIANGSARLAGCTLEPQPVLHCDQKFFTVAGERLSDKLVDELGLSDLITDNKPPRVAAEDIERWTALAKQATSTDATDLEIVWPRWAAGKLKFAIGEQSVELPFADWAARVAPPPYACPLSGKSTFKLASTDDGRIAAAEAIAACDETGRRVLESELVKCTATAKRVLSELTEICPASNVPVLRKALVECPTCKSKISPKAIAACGCPLCAKLETVAGSDSRLCLVIGQHPKLERWRNWQLAETLRSYVLEARGLLKSLHLTVDKRTLVPLRLAERLNLRKTWSEVPRSRWNEWLS